MREILEHLAALLDHAEGAYSIPALREAIARARGKVAEAQRELERQNRRLASKG